MNPSLIRVRPLSDKDNLETVLEIVNEAYKIEIGNKGLAFKEFDRLRTVSDIAKEHIHIALLGVQMVGIIGIEDNGRKACLGKNKNILQCLTLTTSTSGPLAVVPALQGKGIGKALLDYAEDKADITEVGIVSCRTDLLGFYQRRGYKFTHEVPAEDTDINKLEKLTRTEITLRFFEKQNK